jgi:hypothetical protein
VKGRLFASGDRSSKSGILTNEISTFLDHDRANLVEQPGARAKQDGRAGNFAGR